MSCCKDSIASVCMFNCIGVYGLIAGWVLWFGLIGSIRCQLLGSSRRMTLAESWCLLLHCALLTGHLLKPPILGCVYLTLCVAPALLCLLYHQRESVCERESVRPRLLGWIQSWFKPQHNQRFVRFVVVCLMLCLLVGLPLYLHLLLMWADVTQVRQPRRLSRAYLRVSLFGLCRVVQVGPDPLAPCPMLAAVCLLHPSRLALYLSRPKYLSRPPLSAFSAHLHAWRLHHCSLHGGVFALYGLVRWRCLQYCKLRSLLCAERQSVLRVHVTMECVRRLCHVCSWAGIVVWPDFVSRYAHLWWPGRQECVRVHASAVVSGSPCCSYGVQPFAAVVWFVRASNMQLPHGSLQSDATAMLHDALSPVPSSPCCIPAGVPCTRGVSMGLPSAARPCLG